MKTIQYKVERVEDNIRYINVFLNGKLLIELECLGGFLTNEEEIQNWLDVNNYDEDVYEFEKIN